jgi:hypothetical protein
MSDRVSRAELLQRLESVQAGLSPSDIIEQSSCFVFTNGFVHTYNDEVYCRYKSSLSKAITGAVKAVPLLTQLRKWVEDEVLMEMSDGELVMTGKKKKSGFTTEKDILLPIDAIEKPDDGAWREIHADFADALSVVQECVDKHDYNYPRSCVHVHPKYVEACNNMEACRYKVPTGSGKSYLVKKPFIKDFVSLGMREVAETASWVHFRNADGLRMSCRRYVDEGDYPDLTPLLEVNGEKVTLPKGLGGAADKAATFSSEDKDEDHVKVELRPGKLVVTGRGSAGWHREVKGISYTGAEITFMVAPNLLIELIKRHTDCEVTADRLKVVSGKLRYVSCLEKVGDRK